MDYNYVRMRNARKAGDTVLEEHYRKLLGSGGSAGNTGVQNYVIILLAAVAVILGIYIVFTEPSANAAALTVGIPFEGVAL